MVSWCSQVMPLSAALKLAKKERMDLMPVAPQAKPPVFRLGDANEAARQKRLRERESRRRELDNRRKTSMKEASASLPACSRATLLLQGCQLLTKVQVELHLSSLLPHQ